MKKLILIVLSSALLLSCQATVNTVNNKETAMQREAIDIATVSADGFLENRLQITRVDKREQADGLLKVQVTAKNIRTGFWRQIGSWFMGDNPYQVAYRFTWLDKDGMEVETAASTWLPTIIIPGDTIRFQAISPNSRCKDFSLAIRENEGGRS